MHGKLLAAGFIVVGVLVLIQVGLPVVSFKLSEQVFAQSTNLVSPQYGKQKNILGVSIQNNYEFPAFISDLKRESAPNYQYFTLSIPDLKIDGALVEADSNDLNRNLAHLPGSALPGEKGNTFISGHSALPLSLAIPGVLGKNNLAFASLQNIKKNADIWINAGGIVYKYKVVDIKTVKPEDVSVINPPDDSGRYITLMTCVPPGFNTKRLIVVGKLM